MEFEFNVADGPNDLACEGEPFFATERIFTAIPGKVGHHAATITAFDDGELLTAWYAYAGPHELDGSAIYASRREPNASTWSVPEVVVDTPHGDGNPVLYSEGDDVWLFHAVVPFRWSTAHIEMRRSSDRGRTWTASRIVSAALGSSTRFPPIRLADGSLLLPAYDDLLGRSLFFGSSDGQVWRPTSTVASIPGNIQPSIVQLAGGRLLAVMRNNGASWLWVMASDDSGETWSAPGDADFPNPGSPAALLRLASGHLMLVFNDSEGGRSPLSVALSGDEGRTWSAARNIADGDGSFSYPGAVQTPDGLVHLVYTENRETIRHVALNEAWVASHD